MHLPQIKGRVFSMIMETKHLTFVFPLALLLYIYNSRTCNKIGPLINIRNGQIEGTVGVSRDGREFYEFLGIPYARPPVGELRFEPPQPPLNWEGVRLVNDYAPQCTQLEFFTKKILGSEDCLYLNVFVPERRGWIGTDLLPVMVYIHGGYFMAGSSNSYRAEYLMDEDIVLVTINYRTAALGFLNTGDEIVRGNMGLKDQVLALKWIRENIDRMGGDPQRVTLFGASAGAASVHYHVISPMSKGLFHKAISQSGTAIKVWSFVSQPAEQAVRLGKQLNCPTQNTTALVSCLKGLDANKFSLAHQDYLSVFLDPLSIYAPSIEAIQDQNTFLPEHPHEILKKGIENKVPWICGLNSDEGLLFTSRIIENTDSIEQINENWSKVAPSLLAYSGHPNQHMITMDVRKFYFGDTKSINFRRDFQNFTNMLSDRLYFTASRESAQLQRRDAPVFTYYYTYRPQFSFATILQLTGRFPAILELGFDFASNWIHRNLFGKDKTNLGVCHGDELVMLFNIPIISNIRADHMDYNMSKAVVKLWTDFAKTDTYDSLEFKNIKWLPAEQNSPLKYLNLDLSSKIIEEPFSERADFWSSRGLI